MASIRSLSFMVETKADSYVVLFSKNQYRPSSSFSAFRPKKSPIFAFLNNSVSGFSFRSNKSGHLLKVKHVKATGAGFVEDESGNEPEDSLQATIEKSKKVLAMQKQLLQQISERRKLVSSIKSDIANSEEDEVSYEERENSFSDLDFTSTSSSNVVENQNGIIPSSSGDHSTANEAPKLQSSAANRGPDAGGKESENRLSPEKESIDIDSSKLLKGTDTQSTWSDELPSFLSRTAVISSPKEERHEKDLDQVQQIDSEPIEPKTEEAKPPPLAGANVMNVILVAAECGPWSKTGGLGDVAGALPKALARRGHRVMVVAPHYGNYAEPQDTGIRKRYRVDRQDIEVAYFQAYIDGVDFVFLDSPLFRHLGNNIYGGGREVRNSFIDSPLFCLVEHISN
ncbi:hypothetical protein CISIN_1g006770mg [Citrus sinensis]|uniref:Starch synthase catalytic domain-containing protein n=1 Tax=Citrus sinensis TaxID=2711 RepID=A0A067FYX4_CITSI|nr:hypothetical protein CISIN_1g006770mg [Citrus sinensis]